MGRSAFAPVCAVASGFRLLVLVLAGLMSPQAAFAHASLLGSEPPAGATLAQPPTTLRLDFNEPISPLVVRLISPTGEAVTPQVRVENSTLTILPPPLRRGTHVLSWRVISADGHPVGGSLVFSVGAPSAGAASAALDSTAGVKAAIWAMRLLIYLGLFVGVGGASFVALIAQVRPLPARVEDLLKAALVVGLLAALASLGLQGLDALALPLGEIWRPEVWMSALATSYAWTALVAAGAMLLGLISLKTANAALAGLCVSGALAGTGFALGLSGHAATAGLQRFSRAAVVVHGIAIAFWVGSLIPLAAIVRDGGRGEGELARFSKLIPLPLALLIATGAYLAFGELDRPDALWTTGYGEVLSAKLAAVLLLIALAAANRYFLVPRVKAKAAGAAGPLAASIAAETLIVVAILSVVALWRFTPPPRALIGAGATSIHFHGGKAMAQIEVEPVRARGADVSIQVLDANFKPLTAKAVTIFLSNPDAGIEPLRRDAASVDSWNWRIDDWRIPLGGRWRLRVDVLIDDFDKETLEDDVLLPRAPAD